MDRLTKISQLKAHLRKDIAYLCSRADLAWSKPIVRTLREIREAKLRAVFFGGTMRSLLVSRLLGKGPGRPRDLDIVVAGGNVDALRERFGGLIARETRFGGLKLRRERWQFDVWPVERTWAFIKDESKSPDFASLPSTTFFNLESIAMDAWVEPGRTRTIYSGDDQFFDGLITRTLEINLEENPFPVLCVVRSLVMATATEFSIGPRLARYLSQHGAGVSGAELEDIQRHHYGVVRHTGETMRRWLDHVSESYSRDARSPVRLPVPRQLTFWPDDDEGPAMNLHFFSLTHSAK